MKRSDDTPPSMLIVGDLVNVYGHIYLMLARATFDELAAMFEHAAWIIRVWNYSGDGWWVCMSVDRKELSWLSNECLPDIDVIVRCADALG